MLRALCAHVVPLLSDALAEPQEAVARWAAAVEDAREAIPSGASGATCCFASWRNAYMRGCCGCCACCCAICACESYVSSSHVKFFMCVIRISCGLFFGTCCTLFFTFLLNSSVRMSSRSAGVVISQSNHMPDPGWYARRTLLPSQPSVLLK